MKKVLFASTALVAFASAASAEITMKGWAEMGIVGGDRTASGYPMATQFWNDIDIEFTLSGESDSGLSFGARVDLDEAGNLGNTYRNQGTSMFVSGSFGTLTLGDTDGAVDWAMTEAGNIGNPGSISDDETTHAGYLGDYGDGGGLLNGAATVYDNQVLRYDYSFGDFAFAVSLEQMSVQPIGNGVVIDLPGTSGESIGLGVKYALDLGGTTVNLAAGYQTIDFGGFAPTSEDIFAVGASASFAGGFQAGVEFTQFSDVLGQTGEDVDHIGVGIGYASGPIALHVNYGEFDGNAAANAGAFGADRSGWGLTGAYDLGGGLKVKAGVGNSSMTGAPDATVWSLGFTMAF